jgi:hypothetical protein
MSPTIKNNKKKKSKTTNITKYKHKNKIKIEKRIKEGGRVCPFGQTKEVAKQNPKTMVEGFSQLHLAIGVAQPPPHLRKKKKKNYK